MSEEKNKPQRPYDDPKTWNRYTIMKVLKKNPGLKAALELLGVEPDALATIAMTRESLRRAIEEEHNKLNAVATPNRRVGAYATPDARWKARQAQVNPPERIVDSLEAQRQRIDQLHEDLKKLGPALAEDMKRTNDARKAADLETKASRGDYKALQEYKERRALQRKLRKEQIAAGVPTEPESSTEINVKKPKAGRPVQGTLAALTASNLKKEWPNGGPRNPHVIHEYDDDRERSWNKPVVVQVPEEDQPTIVVSDPE